MYNDGQGFAVSFDGSKIGIVNMFRSGQPVVSTIGIGKAWERAGLVRGFPGVEKVQFSLKITDVEDTSNESSHPFYARIYLTTGIGGDSYTLTGYFEKQADGTYTLCQ